MSSTNKTTNYDLSQFIGSDKPAWLVDYNGDMAAIDTQMKANADAAAAAQTTANTADGKADTNAGAISTLDSQINGASGIAADVVAVQGSVNTINSLIGNGEPTTTDKTLIGAINELNSGKADSSDVGHLQCAGMDSVEVTANGVKTNAELLGELFTALNAYIANLTDQVISITTIATPSSHVCNILTTFSSAVSTLRAFDISHGATSMTVDLVVLSNNPSIVTATLADAGVTYTDKSTDVPAADTVFRVRFYVWDVNN